ncbi:hypothetical protein SCALM49S_08739 [Streptomyces californicus]
MPLRVDDDEGVGVQGDDDAVHGDTASEGSRTGSMAVPGPTIAPEKTGSGTAVSPMARPDRGDVTLVMGSLPGGGDSGVAAATDGGRRTAQQRKSYEVPVPPETSRLADLGVHRKRFASVLGDLYCRTPA